MWFAGEEEEDRVIELWENPMRILEILYPILKKKKVIPIMWRIYVNFCEKPEIGEKLGLERDILDELHNALMKYIKEGIEPEEEEEELEEEKEEEEEEF